MKKDVIASELPDLYFIMLDGYANQHILKKYYLFDNSFFLDQLKSYGFYIADSSTSNYYSTLPSLAATLNMGYLQLGSDYSLRLKNNVVFAKLKQLGYTIINLESGYSVTENFSNCDSTISIHSPNEFERSLMKFTILRLDDLFGILHYKRLINQVNCLREINKQSKQTFYFIHIVAPHPPYVFDENGRHLYSSKTHHNSWEPKDKYVQQLKYFNKVVQDFVLQIKNNNPH